ncbi:unnamed protein product [Pleuronectes platessa]|uniref:Uncharacterized protein n=1 Tax=Pleuronectes platessa TaxID=8262 RepID=A0A9N7VPT8_PLEPL|nr:unnamed protein product [Pleuronectes platessa]
MRLQPGTLAPTSTRDPDSLLRGAVGGAEAEDVHGSGTNIWSFVKRLVRILTSSSHPPPCCSAAWPRHNPPLFFNTSPRGINE